MTHPEDADSGRNDDAEPMHAPEEPAALPRMSGPREVPSRYRSVPCGEAGVAIYDRENTEAFVQSDSFVTVPELV
jgi:hypothetical protein